MQKPRGINKAIILSEHPGLPLIFYPLIIPLNHSNEKRVCVIGPSLYFRPANTPVYATAGDCLEFLLKKEGISFSDYFPHTEEQSLKRMSKLNIDGMHKTLITRDFRTAQPSFLVVAGLSHLLPHGRFLLEYEETPVVSLHEALTSYGQKVNPQNQEQVLA